MLLQLMIKCNPALTLYWGRAPFNFPVCTASLCWPALISLKFFNGNFKGKWKLPSAGWPRWRWWRICCREAWRPRSRKRASLPGRACRSAQLPSDKLRTCSATLPSRTPRPGWGIWLIVWISEGLFLVSYVQGTSFEVSICSSIGLLSFLF